MLSGNATGPEENHTKRLGGGIENEGRGEKKEPSDLKLLPMYLYSSFQEYKFVKVNPNLRDYGRPMQL